MEPIALLDGGVGQEIYRRAYRVSSPLWSVAVMLEQPDVVTAVHEDFIQAGARTLTLNTYSATPTRLEKQGLSGEMARIHRHAFDALNRAIDKTGVAVDIAACLPPLTGSYQARPTRRFTDLYQEYTTLAEQQADADVVLVETMTNTHEAVAACAVAGELGKPFGVAFRLEAEGRLRSGETLAEAVAAVRVYSPTAIMLNCCDPEVLTAAMPGLAGLYSCVGGYANAFRSIQAVADGGLVDSLEARGDVSPHVYSDQVGQWVAQGAAVVGGCCEITPAHIRRITDNLTGRHPIIPFSRLHPKS